ncbi:hypothetical protein Q5P01_000335 [Channa striata]|uniref:CCHC-type domain-containing protein n=1 Tax=Channa striata TaxID=64152 RepID=A0AA88IIY7_CHASR|nr:hypothetical protein Q5P01_000335 [Channa striata]
MHQTVNARCMDLVNEHPLAVFEVLNLDKPNFRIITIHTFNPYVSDLALKDFLGHFTDSVSAPRYVRDPFGFWTGRRQFQVLLKQDVDGHDGLKHPPAFFQLGADRGYLFYARQPPFCRRCRSHGHGHVAAACHREKTCNGCGKSGHMYKGCPDRRRTFAEVAGEAGGVEVAVSGRGSTGQQRTGNGVPEERVKELRMVDQSLRVGEVEVLPVPATAGPSGLQTKGKRVVEGGELESHGPVAESLDGQVRTSPRQVGAATSKEQMRRDSQSSLNDGKGEPDLSGGRKSTKRIKGLTSTRAVGGGSVDEQGRLNLCTIVPETAPTLGDTAIETFGLDFTFSPDMLSLPLLRGADQEEIAVQQDGTGVSSCSWAQQMESMEVYEERQPARSEDG